MMKKRHLLLTLVCIPFLTVSLFAQKKFEVKSPNEKLEVNIEVGKTIEYAISHAGDQMLAKSPISMTLSDGQAFGIDSKFKATSKRLVNESIAAPFYKKTSIKDNYNELRLKFNDFDLLFRAYDDGIAYRFVSKLKKEFVVENEQATFNFAHAGKAYIPYVKNKKNSIEEQFFNSFENTYEYIALADWDKDRLAFSPLVVESANGKKIAIAESDLLNYPGMFLHNGDASESLKGVFATHPKEVKIGGHNMLQGMITSREEYIAKCEGQTNFPWRIVIVSEADIELADSDMVYKLATPNQLGDISWIKPGKVAWDWWNDWNLRGVDFRAGVNNETYKYYIDFAAEHGIEYVILDEGWAVNKKTDLFQVVPEIDLPQLAKYAESKQVGLILWAGYYAFDRDMEEVCKRYSEMGVKGFKVDFMDRDDQAMVAFHHRAAQVAAKYELMLDFHGTYKPTGLQRTYPNVINFEGVNGLEQMKWASITMDQVTYDVTIPYIRQIAGPMDYTQGAMRNGTKHTYRGVNSEAMSQGTRCRQLAQYVIFESPLNMLCDSPSNYKDEPECTSFIAAIPTVWDETVVLNGEISKYITTARQKDGVWYLGSMTNWDARTLDLDLSFLGNGEFHAEIYKDGINADRSANDYKKEAIDIPVNKQIQIKMASGGGYAMKIMRK